MINLLPPDVKASYHYAHRNVGLVRWVIGCAFGLVGVVVISTAGLVYIHQSRQPLQQDIIHTEASLQAQKLDATQQQVQDISNSLKLAVQVLSKEVLFSKLLQQLATVTPPNTVLSDLTINQAQNTVTITALTTDYTAATQLQVNLSDPNNKIFSHADLVNIVCSSGTSSSSGDARYPCTATINALFTTNNPFLLMNDQGGTQ